MKPIVIDTKKSDLLPISYICRTTAPLSRLPAGHVVERPDEDRVELARADEEVDRGGAEVVHGSGRLRRDGAHLVRQVAFFGGHGSAHPSRKLTR